MTPDMPRLELVCFGPPTAYLGGREAPVEVLWRKHLALLIYLALSPRRTRSRDHLLGIFWGERPEAKARHSLAEALSRLRQVLGEERLRSEATNLVLNDAGLEVDALRLAAMGESAAEDALPLLRGDFLEGFFIDDAPDFDEWVTRERERYRALAATTLVAAGEGRLTRGRLAEAGDAARRALALAPRSEPAIRLLMRAAALAGDAATALASYQEFTTRLEREVGERSSNALSALAKRIRSRTWRPAGVADVAREAPLVGRERLNADALETVRQGLGRGPRTLVIAGAPGMGRTRLLAECARSLGLEGAAVVIARPLESDHDAPWSTLRFLLRAGLGGAPGLPGARPDALAALAALAPELAEKFAPRPARDVADMAAALANVLSAVAAERAVALAIDDAQWADGASLAALASAVAELRGVRLVLLLTVAQGVGEPPRELIKLQGEVGRSLPGLVVRLDPLSEEDIRTLVDALAVWCREDADRARLARRLAFETGGSPFFAVTLLAALQRATTLRADLVTWPPPQGTSGAPLPFSIPSLVRHALAVRVAELDQGQQAILAAASVCGQVLDPALVAHVVKRPLAEVEGALPAFERRQLVTFDGQRYAFVAPLVTEVIRTECLTRGERRRHELRASEALAGRTDLESRALRAELLAHAAPGDEALDLALTAAREAVAVGAARIARRALAAAERASRDREIDASRRAQLKEMRDRV